jgi:tetratricopeptide (TPR) repeat protein
VIVPTVVLIGAGAVAWRALYDAPRPSESLSPLDQPVPVVPRRLEPPRREHLDRVQDGTYAAAFERGVAAYNIDDVEAAADAFEEAVRLAPHEAEAHINLGLVYMRLQRPDDGLRELAAGAALERDGASAPSPAPDDEIGPGEKPDGTIGTHGDPARSGP